ncbi:PEP-CTERM sorting domain-containing protein [Roseateles sp.]|uniref:PEP-CTERM sorting domain-containing protein n=1 Tax=Roseateles sp. TaxID=1971397 RepID=UPI00326760BA
MKFKSLAVVAAFAALSATGAQAASFTTFDGGAHGDYKVAFSDVSGLVASDYFFTLSQASDLTATFSSSKVKGSVGLYSAADDSFIGGWGFGAPASSLSNLMFSVGTGSYYYEVLSNGTGSFTLTSAAMAAAVPEPETYAMLAAGLGIVGFVASRRRRND